MADAILKTKELCPAQQHALEGLQEGFRRGHVMILRCENGRGRTTVLRTLARESGAHLVTIRDFLDAMYGQNPLAMEEIFLRVIMDALVKHSVVFVDDLHLIGNVTCCGHAYPRRGFFEAPLMTVAAYAEAAGKQLLLGDDDGNVPGVMQRAHSWEIPEFRSEDYAHICRSYLGEKAEGIDFQRVYRFAPSLSAHQLRGACVWLRNESDQLTTDGFLDYLRSQHMNSNVDLGEVQAVCLDDLMGINDIIASLEANIILPLEDDNLATRLKIKPKRGVLIAGPPGTGKTTIGRALAHRLRSKFFLIDGTFISGTRNFYERIHYVFAQAKRNAPSIIFIDDSDVIFESGEEMGLYRYLLTMLDGLESESAGRVCVMMTAMDVSSLPPALIRSGRIELWLETRLPDEAARVAILQGVLDGLPAQLGTVDIAAIAAASNGLTGADLKRVAEDGKILFAFDCFRKSACRAGTEYFFSALETVRSNRERYMKAEGNARQRQSKRPIYYEVTSG